ncbi:glutathione S-transferase [Ceratobasidium sp. AG-Ba]|nr:glutathione S-transferase [Ceratobasidium sp. AG-Ba]
MVNTYRWIPRITLNLKGLPYRVVKLSFPEIEEKYKELNLPPPYILPLIADPSNDPDEKPTYVSDSFKIATYLDDKYPGPRYPTNIPARLDERGAEYWYLKRGHRFPRLPEDVAAQKWQEVSQKWDGFGKCFDVNEDGTGVGPFVMGSQATFVDFAIGGVFHFFQQIEGEDSPRLKDMMQWQDGRWRALRDKILAIEKYSSEIL